MTKERLRALRDSLRELDQIREEIASAEARIYGLRAQAMSDMPKAPSHTGDPTSDGALLHLRLLERYERRLAAAEQEMLEVEEALDVLEPVERVVIRYRYFDLMSWEEVCAHINYGWAQTHRIHSAALQKLETVD